MFNALMLYLLISIIYLVVQYRKDPKNIVVKLLIVLLCPFIGLMIIYFMFHNISNDAQENFDHLIMKENENREVLQKVNFEKETSIVPMKDALLINDNQTKRKMLLDILKNDAFLHFETLQAALHNDDTETSHYAATAIQDIKSKLLNSLQQLEYEVEKQPDNVNLLVIFAQLIKQYVNTGFMDERTERRYLYQYSNILERVIERAPQEKEYYIEKVNCDLQLKEIESAEEYCKLFLRFFPTDEDAYFLSMKLYYSIKNQMKFNEILQMLRQSSVRLSPKGLNKIRFWITGETNGA